MSRLDGADGLLSVARAIDSSSLGSLVLLHSFIRLVPSGPEESLENVVLVGGDDELLHGETEFLRVPASKDVTKVTSRYHELKLGTILPGLFGELEVSGEVVDDLSEDTGPVDRVDSTETVSSVELGIGEEGLDDALTSVKVRILNGDAVNVGVGDGGHLSLLDRGHSAVGVEDENGDGRLGSETVDGSTAKDC